MQNSTTTAARPKTIGARKLATGCSAVGMRVRHPFAGYGTVIEDRIGTIHVQWDNGHRGWAYRSDCWLSENGSDVTNEEKK